MVNMLNRNAKITRAPYPGQAGPLPAAPRGHVGMLHDYIEPTETFVTCPNQDVAYGLGFFSLDEEPVIAQVPDFGGRFWVYALYDARTDQFGELGRPYRSRPGFYLLVGPKWKGEKPAGVEAVLEPAAAVVESGRHASVCAANLRSEPVAEILAGSDDPARSRASSSSGLPAAAAASSAYSAHGLKPAVVPSDGAHRPVHDGALVATLAGSEPGR